MLRVPSPTDSILLWFSVKLSGCLAARGCLELKDLEKIIGKIDRLPGVGKSGVLRIQEVWRAMDGGHGLPYVGNDEAALEGQFEPEIMPQPTNFAPGSEGKKRELRRRVELGQAIWHPDDMAYETAIRDASMAFMRQRSDFRRKIEDEAEADEE